MKQKIYLLILTLMLCVGQDAWGDVKGTYNSTTKTLSFTGSGMVTQSIVRGISGYADATSVSFGSDVTAIGDKAFYGSKLTSVKIPSNVSKIGSYAFYNSINLTLIQFLNASTTLNVGYNAFGAEGSTNAASLTFYSNRQFSYSMVYDGLTYVGSGLFHNDKRLKSVTIGANIASIPEDTFRECTNLSSLSLTHATELTSIDDFAFKNCTSLTSISIPESVERIGTSAFEGTSLTSVTIPASVKSVAKKAFFCCRNLSTLTFANGSTPLTVYDFAFGTDRTSGYADLTFNCNRNFSYVYKDEYANFGVKTSAWSGYNYMFYRDDRLKKVVIGANVTSIPETTFESCSSLSTVDMINATDLTDIGRFAFVFCKSLTTATLPSSLKTISLGAFSDCTSLTSVNIPESVETIGTSAFEGTSLTSVTIPASVKSVAKKAFFCCRNLSTLTFANGSTPLTVYDFAFGTDRTSGYADLTFNCNRNFSYVYNDEYANLGYKTSAWSGYNYMFYKDDRLKKVVIGANVTSIPEATFRNCSSLSTVDMINATDLTDIGIYSFANCASLPKVTLPFSLKTVSNGTFYGCTNLSYAYILGTPTLGTNAFPASTTLRYQQDLLYGEWLALYAGEKSTMTELRIPNDNVAGYSYTTTANLNKEFPKLKKVIFGEKVTKIGNSIFYVENGKTNNLETVVFEGEPVAVGSCSFYRCSKLANIQGSIKSVSDGSFRYCSSLRAVELTDDTELECAFADCTSLQSIVLPNNLKTIAAWDFQNCTALTSITIPSSVTSVQKNSFWNCTNLKTVIINSASVVNPSTTYTSTLNLGTIFPNASTFQLGEAVTAIGANAFYGCSKITSFVIPANVTTINTTAFDGCTNLTDLTIASNTIASKNWTSSSNVNTIFPNLKKVVFGKDVKAIGEYAFSVPSDKTNNIETIVFEGNPVDVGSSAFRYNTKLAKIGKVKSVGTSSFSNCSSLESIEITGDDVVDASAFSACSSLKSVTLPNTLTTINQYAFKDCIGLTSIDIPSNVTSINVEAFRNCTNLSNLKVSSNTLASKNWTSTSNMNTIFPYLKKVVFGKDVKAIGENMFYMPDKSNNIETVVFEGNPVDVGSYAFYYNTKLAKIEGNVKSVSASSFACCSGLESVSISDDATIERNAFAFCYSLKSVTLPTTLTTIEQYAFNKCRSLTSIEIPSDVTSIDVNAFNGATNLSEVRISSDSMVNPSTPYDATYNLGKIFPYATKVELNLFAWNPVIGDYAFYGATALKSVIAGSVLQRISEIGANAFKGCTNLVLGDDPKFKNTWGYVKTIGESAFEGCTSLKLDELPTNVTTINAATFKGCTGLTSLILPEKLSTVALDAFEGCVNLTDVTINGNAFAGAEWTSTDNLRIRFPYATDITFGKNVTSVGDLIYFSRLTDGKLERVTFNGNPSIGKFAFNNAAQLKSVTGSVKSVAAYSFAGCVALPSITITDDAVIDNNAFFQCNALNTINLPNNVSEIGAQAFYECYELAEIKLPNSVSKLSMGAFRGCISLKEITLPANVRTIAEEVFSNCVNIKKVTALNPTPVALTESMNVFKRISATAELEVPGSSLNAYKTAEVWKNFYSYFASDGVKLVDGEPYTRTVSEVVPMVRYTRTFSEKNVGKWQSFYVPFDIEITEELLADYEFAKLYMVSHQDANNNDIIDSTDPLKMIFNKVKVGSTLKGNTPYYIKAKRLDTKPIEVVNTLLLAAENGSVDCRTTEDEYTLIGVNEPTIVQWKYVMANSGNFTRITSPTSKLGSFRWYMEIKSRNEDENDNYARPILIEVEGENDVTSIVDVNGFAPKSEIKKVYTLDGRQVTDIDNLPSGIYIINGKKVVKK